MRNPDAPDIDQWETDGGAVPPDAEDGPDDD